MNTNNLQIGSVYSIESLNLYLNSRVAELREVVNNIDGAINELGEVKAFENKPYTLKQKAKWLGKKIHVVDDSIRDCIKMSSKLNFQISNQTKNHIIRIRMIAISYIPYFKKVPFEIKLGVITCLDHAYEKDMEELNKKFVKINKKLGFS